MTRSQLIALAQSVIFQNTTNLISAQSHQYLELQIINSLFDATDSIQNLHDFISLTNTPSVSIPIPAGTWIDKIIFRVKGSSTVNVSDDSGDLFGAMKTSSVLDMSAGGDYQTANNLIITIVGDPIDLTITKHSI
jgi:hypothetical protein